MLPSTVALFIGTLATLAAASPTPVFEQQACTTIYPSALQVIKSTDPDKSFENTAPAHFENKSAVTVQQDQTNGNEPDRILQFIEFEIPHGPEVWGCQLSLVDKAKSLTWTNVTNGQPAPAMNVIALWPNCNHGDVTYNNIIRAKPSVISAGYFGYFVLTPGGHQIINSEACPALTLDGKNGRLAFVFEYEYPNWKGNMEWSLLQQLPSEDGVQEFNGVFMTYGACLF